MAKLAPEDRKAEVRISSKSSERALHLITGNGLKTRQR